MNLIQTSKESLNFIYKNLENNFKNANYAEDPQRTQTQLVKDKQGNILEKPQNIKTNVQKEQHNKLISESSKYEMAEYLINEISVPLFDENGIFYTYKILNDIQTLSVTSSQQKELSLLEMQKKFQEAFTLHKDFYDNILHVKNRTIDDIKKHLTIVNQHISTIDQLNHTLEVVGHKDFSILDAIDKEISELSQIIDLDVQYKNTGAVEKIYSPMLRANLLTQEYLARLDFTAYRLDNVNDFIGNDMGKVEISFHNWRNIENYKYSLDLYSLQNKDYGGWLQAWINENKIIEVLSKEFSESFNSIINSVNRACSENILHGNNHLTGSKLLDANHVFDLENNPIELFIVQHNNLPNVDALTYSADQKYCINQDKISKIWGIDTKETTFAHIVEAMNYELDFKRSNNQVKIGLINDLNDQAEINNVVLVKNTNQDLILEVEGNGFQTAHVKIKSVSYKDLQGNDIKLLNDEYFTIDQENSAIFKIGNLNTDDIPHQTEIIIQLSLTNTSGEEIPESNNIKIQFDLNTGGTQNNYFFANNDLSSGGNLKVHKPSNQEQTVHSSFIKQGDSNLSFLDLKMQNDVNNNHSVFIHKSERFLEKSGLLDLVYYNYSDNIYAINDQLIDFSNKKQTYISEVIKYSAEKYEDKQILYEISPHSNFFYRVNSLLNDSNLENKIKLNSYNVAKIIESAKQKKASFLGYLQDISFNSPTSDQIIIERNTQITENFSQIQWQFSVLKVYMQTIDDFFKIIN